MNKENERTEYIGLYVTPEVKKQIDSCNDNDSLKEKIVKDFFKNESDWLSSEMKEIDDITIKYKAKLIFIKEHFTEAQDSYVEEIEKIMTNTAKVIEKLDNINTTIKDKIDTTKRDFQQMADTINKLPIYQLEQLFNLLDRYSNMSDKEKELMVLILNNK